MDFVAFFEGTGKDDKGRLIGEICAYGAESLERNHDYIQRIFPLAVPSQCVTGAPTITGSEVTEICDRIINQGPSDTVCTNVARCIGTMTKFYGLDFEAWDPYCVCAEPPTWVTPMNHNFLRLTRIMKSLCLFGCHGEAACIFNRLFDLYHRHPEIIGYETFCYWKEAGCRVKL